MVRRGHDQRRTRTRLTGNSKQPQPHQHYGNQFITEKNMCDDVNANKSLYGNERETPSIRSHVARPWARESCEWCGCAGALALVGWGIMGVARWDGWNGGNHIGSDMRARNRTRDANVSLGADVEIRGRPPVPGDIR